MNDSTDAAVTWATVAAQRAVLAGELDRLGAGQWNEPSLCQGWQVRHVVAHLIGEATTTRTRTAASIARHGFRLNAFIRSDALRRGEQPPARLAAAYRSAGNTGARVQVLRHQPDGSWLRIMDRPEVPQP